MVAAGSMAVLHDLINPKTKSTSLPQVGEKNVDTITKVVEFFQMVMSLSPPEYTASVMVIQNDVLREIPLASPKVNLDVATRE